jgi:hypothetical protein
MSRRIVAAVLASVSLFTIVLEFAARLLRSSAQSGGIAMHLVRAPVQLVGAFVNLFGLSVKLLYASRHFCNFGARLA